ncbi:MFS transporter [Blastomonas sp.]|uniref:MFS transporter n=1 Tax=Blastomonas sp. TaxID=1909299 RepID=UPI00391C14FA
MLKINNAVSGAGAASDGAGRGMSPFMITVFALACGLMAANLYYAQSLIAVIGEDLGISVERLGLIVTLTQVGYCAGLLFIVPLADRIENRRLVLALTLAAAVGIAGAAAAQSAAMFLIAVCIAGICSVGAQVLVPLAAHLSLPDRQGRVIGYIMAGLLAGIMLARPFASALTQGFGWRVAFAVPSALMVVLALVLALTMPRRQPEGKEPFLAILRSMAQLLGRFSQLRRRAFYQACLFGSFNVFWTAAPLALEDRFGFDQGKIALFALAGAGGALAAPFAGRLADGGRTRIGSAAAMLGMAVCFAFSVPAVVWGSVIALAVLAIAIDAATQTNQVLGQARVYSLAPQFRGRINAVYISLMFVGGAIGSGIAPLLYAYAGWAACAGAGAGFALLALAVWATEPREQAAG